MKTAFFRFEASPTIGAGHAMRSCVLADSLREIGWECFLLTHQTSYEFIEGLNRFQRVDPQNFYKDPLLHDLLVIDNYDVNISYEQRFRPFAKKIMVIDDLANRLHECDILLDQTYGRQNKDYKNLVPAGCQILSGQNYTLIRKEFFNFREKSKKKREQTKAINRVLISMGGGNSIEYIFKVLNMLKNSQYKGEIDIVLGMKNDSFQSIMSFIDSIPNKCNIHINPSMPQLIYDADLAIGGAGSSVWERCVLGLPQCVLLTADNQEFCLSQIKDFCHILDFNSEDLEKNFSSFIQLLTQKYQTYSSELFDKMSIDGVKKIIKFIEED